MSCWNCGTKIEEKVGFRTICEKCGMYLHSCLGCKHYQKGYSNDCKIPGTETVADRSALNYCEEFSPTEKTFPIKDVDAARKKFEDFFS